MATSKYIFVEIDTICKFCHLIALKHHRGFLKNYPIRKIKIFGTIKCVVNSGTCPRREIKVA